MDNIWAVIGQKLTLYTRQSISGNVTLKITISEQDAIGAWVEVTNWLEYRTAADASTFSSSPPAGAVSAVSWTASVDSSHVNSSNIPDDSYNFTQFNIKLNSVTVEIWTGHSTTPAAGSGPFKIDHKVLLPGFDITDNETLLKIMHHEFIEKSTYSGHGTINEDLKNFLRDTVLQQMTLAQRNNLANYRFEQEWINSLLMDAHRVVNYATLQPKPGPQEKRMGMMDMVWANAHLTTFHLRGAEYEGEYHVTQVTLICHTEYFLIHLGNKDTQKLIRGKQNGIDANDWLKRTNESPPKFFLTCFIPSPGHHQGGLIWFHLFDTKGNNVMADTDNAIHGQQETDGCWSLFRNFNWPTDPVIKHNFGVIYHNFAWEQWDNPLRLNANKLRASNKLALYGHDVTGDHIFQDSSTGEYKVSSFYKFLYMDRNNAYTWFLRYIVGIQYYSRTFRHRRAYKRHTKNEYEYIYVCSMHDQITPAFVNAKTAVLGDGSGSGLLIDYASTNGDDAPAIANSDWHVTFPTDKYCFHHFPSRKAEDDKYRSANTPFPDKSILISNELGFRTTTDFVGEGVKKLNGRSLYSKTWADIYFYKTDGTDIKSNTIYPQTPNSDPSERQFI